MDNRTSCIENEHKQLHKFINYRLPNQYKKIGLIGALVIFLSILAYKFVGSNTLIVKDILRTVTILFLLIASVSKDPFEDEYIKHIRLQSYVIAVVISVIYAVFIPLIAIVFDVIITKITGDGSVSFHQASAFEILFNLMCFQLLAFETLKRFGRA